MKNIVVFCGSSLGFNSIYKDNAIKLGNYFVKNNITMVYGGGKIGLMGTIADTMIEKNGKVVGIIPELLKQEEVVHTNISKVITTKTMSERKIMMSKLADGYIALPGGFGTLDELFEALTLGQLYIEQKPVGLLNVNGFFDFLLQQLDTMVTTGFLNSKNRDLLLVATTIEGLMEQMLGYKAPKISPITTKIVRK